MIENLKINFMILDKRSLLISEKLFGELYSLFLLYTFGDNETQLIGYKNLIDSKKIDFLFSIEMTEEILLKSFNIDFIDNDYENIWEQIEKDYESFEAIEIQIKNKYSNFNSDLKSKIIKYIKYIFELSNYKINNFILKEFFILVNVGDEQYIFTTKSSLTLNNIKTLSYYLINKKKYTIFTLSDTFFYSFKKEIEYYKNTRVEGLSEIRNPFLMTYLSNNMTNDRFGDFNLSYFYGDETNPYKINCSVRIDGKYKMINYSNISDFDLNVVDSDIITIGGKLSGVNTVTNLKVGRFSYRCLIIRKNGIYFLNLRKTEGILYDVKDLSDKAGIEIDKFIIDPELNDNKNVWIEVEKKMKHFDIDFPLGYKQQDIDVFFNKLMSSSKGTFFINGKTNSWKSTSLKNLLKNFLDENISNGNNKNIMMIENPIEGFDYYLKQIEVDDEDVEDYKSIIMGIKRADLDLCVIGELRTYDVFGIVNEISNSLPVFSTFHVGTAESFLSILKYYSDKAELNYLDVFGNVNVSLVQIPLDYEKAEKNERYYYKKEEKEELMNYIYSRFRLNTDDLIDEEIEFKKLLKSLIDLIFEKNMFPIKKYKKAKRRLYYENLTGDMLSLFITKRETEFSAIYKYLGYTNNILYATLMDFINGEMIFDNVKLDEYSFDVKIKTINEIKKYINNI